MVQYIPLPKYEASPLMDLSPLASALDSRQRAQQAQAQALEDRRRFEMQNKRADTQLGLAQNADQRAAEMAPLDRQYKLAQIGKAQREAATGGAGKLEVSEIYDEQGRKQKVAFNPLTGATTPLGGAQAVKPDQNVSVGQKAVDRDFAKDYVEFSTGGFADAQKNLDQLRLVHRELTDPKGPNLTGWFTGNTPDIINSVVNPKAVDRRELVEEVVQRNLRLILGAQFTQREGDRLIARAFNPALDEKANAARLSRLIGAMDQALQAKKAAAQYYEQNGTLAGFKGPTRFSGADFESAIDGGAGAAPPQNDKPGSPLAPGAYNWTPNGLQPAR